MNFERNTKGTDYFVGDLHGAYTKFMSLLHEVGFDKNVDRVFSVGDLVDRGPESEQCMGLLARPWFHAVRGNHEQMMIEQAPYWSSNGGEWGYLIDDNALQAYRQMAMRMPIHMTVETVWGKIGVVHAEPHQDWNDMDGHLHDSYHGGGVDGRIWGRTIIQCARAGYHLEDPIANIDAVVVGHTIRPRVEKVQNILYIDTGGYTKLGKITLLTARDVFTYINN